ncbi:DUF1697 domain-containing protein [Mesorhizobium marinum]|uniref:DUF1697 domain-containing protein n=1 Tax=Mesorhizobium marinum TaxID=3228790 RepID=UPI003467AB59
MTVYVVLFRGVGGATQLPVKPLREALTAAGFKDVATYINSGNAVLSSRKGAAGVAADVAKIAKKEFGFDKAIHVVTREDWTALIDNNPFPEATQVPKFLHAAVLAEKPKSGAVDALRAFARGKEGIEVVGGVAYLYTPDGFGTSKLAEKFDKGIGVPNTARNWNTVIALAKLADAIR